MLAPAFGYPPKSPEAFRTISEVSALLDVPQHVLRFWESRFAQVKPVKRAGGRRYYRPEDVDLLRGIRALLYSDGFTIKGVQKVFRDRGVRAVTEIGRADDSPLQAGIDSPEPAIQTVEPPEPESQGARIVHLRPSAQTPREDLFADVDLLVRPDTQMGACRLAEEERVRLEILLAELQRMKTRLRRGG